MPVVKEVIGHILHHVNAEAAESDPSQVAGVAQRAQLVRDAVQGFIADDRDITLRDLLQAISAASPAGADQQSFRNAIVSVRAAGSTRPQLAIQAWVGKALEQRRG